MHLLTDKPPTSIAPARVCAHRVLRRVFEGGAYAEKALISEARELDTRDRGLAMRLAFGAVQRAGTLDHLIGTLAGRPAERLDAQVLASLRLGLYELLYLRGAPDYAVVADAVELSKLDGGRGHGLVNAVLRRAGREGAQELLGSLSDETPAGAAIKHSHPEWIARLWWDALGAQEARALMARDNEPPELALRANTLVCTADELAERLEAETHGDARIPEAVVLDQPFDIQGSELWREGAFTAQSRAAMLVGRTLAPEPGERVLDLCAAPGGKSTHLAALMEGRGELVAVESNPRRARSLAHTAARMKAGNVKVEVADARVIRDGESFDRVLVDPPCSGLGTMQARPDLRWRASRKAIEEMRVDQSRILAAGAEVLRPGGVLVYSTCTISPTENERQIADFLAVHPDFRLEDPPAETADFTMSRPLADEGQVPPESPKMLLTLPHRHNTAGFFIARLRRA
jgi:16S rRNA (cytosine967-C5)-methyltransferase